MKEFWQNLLEKMKNPSKAELFWTYTLAVLFSAGSIAVAIVGIGQGFFAVCSYVLFGLAGVSLGLAVFHFVRFVPHAKDAVTKKLNGWEFTRRLLRNYGFRTVIFAIGTFVFSVAYGVFNGVLGVVGRSIWYGALAAYYIMLALLRGGVLLYHKRKNVYEDAELVRAKTYRTCGVLLLVLNVALSSAIAQMIFEDQHFTYPGWTIYAFAAYAFYKITMSLINLFKAQKQDDLTVQAIRNINLVDATVSILALQTAMLTTFLTDESISVSWFNTGTGSAVSIFSVALSVWMIVTANKRIKKIQAEKKSGK